MRPCGFGGWYGEYNAGEVASGIAASVVSTEIKHYLEDARPEDKTKKP